MRTIFLIPIIMLSFVSCKYGVTYGNLKDLKNKQASVELVSSEDLTIENQKLLRIYFSSIKDLIYEYKNNQRMRSYTYKKFFKYFSDDFCEEGVAGEDLYRKIMSKCTVNGFYICSDEVRYYKEMLLEAKKLFTEVEFNKILKSDVCKQKLNKLGVINE